jgi:hypothetical protein
MRLGDGGVTATRHSPADVDRIVAECERIAGAIHLPTPSPLTVLPDPISLNTLVYVLQRTAGTLRDLAHHTEKALQEVMWVGPNAAAFRGSFQDRKAQALRVAARLDDLVFELRNVQQRVRAEIAWLNDIESRVREFLHAVHAAAAHAEWAAKEAVDDAARVAAQSAGAVLHAAWAGVDFLHGEDPRAELYKSVDHARESVKAQVDLLFHWEFGPDRLPPPRCPAWHHVEDFVERKSLEGQSFGIPYHRSRRGTG